MTEMRKRTDSENSAIGRLSRLAGKWAAYRLELERDMGRMMREHYQDGRPVPDVYHDRRFRLINTRPRYDRVLLKLTTLRYQP